MTTNSFQDSACPRPFLDQLQDTPTIPASLFNRFTILHQDRLDLSANVADRLDLLRAILQTDRTKGRRDRSLLGEAGQTVAPLRLHSQCREQDRGQILGAQSAARESANTLGRG